MNRKGEVGVGMIVMIAVILIIGAIFVQIIAQEVGSSINTVQVSNVSFTAAAQNGTSYIVAYREISDVTIINGTGGAELTDSIDYTVTNNQLTNGNLAVAVTMSTDTNYSTETLLISGTGKLPTYIASSGGRSMASLIIVFFALAVVIVAILPTVKSGVLGMMGR